MNELIAALGPLFGKLSVLIAVAPWEQGLRVRGGKHVTVLGAGLHWRVPFLDVIHVQSVRRRTSQVCTQTVATMDGRTVMVGATLGYAVKDIALLYDRLHHAEDTLSNIVAVAIAGRVSSGSREELTAGELARLVTEDVRPELSSVGLDQIDVRITDFAPMRAFRLVQDSRGSHSNADILKTVRL
jgi:regulator of protease activity HflC (stomatin/prohibitin superfamily)